MPTTQRQPGPTQRSTAGADTAPDGELPIELPQGQEDLRSLMDTLQRIGCAAADSQRRRVTSELLEKLRRHAQPCQESPARPGHPRPDVWLTGSGILLGIA